MVEHSEERDQMEETRRERRREVGFEERNIRSPAEPPSSFGETERALVDSAVIEAPSEPTLEEAREAAVTAAHVEDSRMRREELLSPIEELAPAGPRSFAGPAELASALSIETLVQGGERLDGLFSQFVPAGGLRPSAGVMTFPGRAHVSFPFSTTDSPPTRTCTTPSA